MPPKQSKEQKIVEEHEIYSREFRRRKRRRDDIASEKQQDEQVELPRRRLFLSIRGRNS